MDISIEHIERLLETLSRKTGQSRDHHGFGIMSDMIDRPEISRRYLYDNLSRGVSDATSRKKGTINLQIHKLDIIAQFLGFENFKRFVSGVEQPLSPVLKSMVGRYYSYVRRNAKNGVIYRSPVKISEADERIMYTLRGPLWDYTGEISLSNGCLFVLLESQSEKSFYHVYKIGKREQPIVLQGIFSGVSTAFDPIGGRVVLIRDEAIAFDKMTNHEFSLDSLRKSEVAFEQKLFTYFSNYGDNNLRIKNVVSYELDDLE
jgi:hypothetical protein